jgi:hypothetical protein
MEATGVYWKPVWHILSDGEFELVLANAAHVKNLPDRKTDVRDAEWVVLTRSSPTTRMFVCSDTDYCESRQASGHRGGEIAAPHKERAHG